MCGDGTSRKFLIVGRNGNEMEKSGKNWNNEKRKTSDFQ
jgi:hypothetical protein